MRWLITFLYLRIRRMATRLSHKPGMPRVRITHLDRYAIILRLIEMIGKQGQKPLDILPLATSRCVCVCVCVRA